MGYGTKRGSVPCDLSRVWLCPGSAMRWQGCQTPVNGVGGGAWNESVVLAAA